jgi:non-ribosomal peptide synthetase component E (peptide arylation enzyme)
MTIQQYLLKSFAQHSENIAIIHDGVSFSYQELYASATLACSNFFSDKNLATFSAEA